MSDNYSYFVEEVAKRIGSAETLAEKSTTYYANDGYSQDTDNVSYKGTARISKLHDIAKKHKLTKGVEFHTARGDDDPHAVTVHHDSPAHKHPEFSKHLKKMPQYKNESVTVYGETFESISEAVQG